MKTKKMQKVEQAKSDWNIINKTIKRLEVSISEAEIDNKTIPDALILAQQLNNQIDYFEDRYSIPNEIVPGLDFKKIKQKRDSLYKLLYVIFDKLSNDEMIDYVEKSLNSRVAEYKIFVEDIEKSSDQYILKMLELRDEIKYLYDELDIWTGRWSKRGDRIETCDITDKFCQEIGGYDVLLRKFILDNQERFNFLKEEAGNNLIKKPDGSKRFDFWWWNILE